MFCVRSTLARSFRIACAFLLLCSLAPTLTAFGQVKTPAPEVIELLATLQGDDLLARERAALRLAELKPAEAVPDLRQVFLTVEGPRPAAMALAGIGTPGAMAVLISALADEQLSERRNAAQIALLSSGEASVPSLLVGLQAIKPSTRQHSAELLGAIGSTRAVDPLLHLARQDRVPAVRLAAVQALGEMGDPLALRALRTIAGNDPDPSVRAEAGRAISLIGGEF